VCLGRGRADEEVLGDLLIGESRRHQPRHPTAQKVFKALREEGLIHTEPGMGSFVVEDDMAED
jgi:hypothetical protein